MGAPSKIVLQRVKLRSAITAAKVHLLEIDLAAARRRALQLEDQIALAQADSARLDWVLENRLLRVQGSGDCWHVTDCRGGLTFLVQAAPSPRAAIDAARAKLEDRHE